MTHALRHRDRLPQRLAPFLVYVVVFHVLWIGWAYGIYPWLRTLGEATLQYALANLSLRLLIWVAPVVVYLRQIDHVAPLPYLQLTQRWQRGLLIGLAFTALNLLLSLARFGVPQPTLQAVTWNSLLSTSLLIGVIEEIPYRGFMLQKFQERLPFWAANLIASLLFVAIHLPGWLALHLLRVETVTFVFVFSLIMGVLFRLAQSLWSVIVAHSLNDFLNVVIFGH